METTILGGSLYQQGMMKDLKAEINLLSLIHHKQPGIAFIAMVGHEPLLKYTIGLHLAAAEGLGFKVLLETRPHDVAEREVIEIIDKLNLNEDIHAIVLLQPIPQHLSSINLTRRINPDKEVEGFHPMNMMDTAINGIQHSRYPMCLPVALLELFSNENLIIKEDSEFVFIFDDYFFSNPFTKLILRTATSIVVPDNCSNTILSTGNHKLAEHCRSADYLFVISKQVEFLKSEWLKPGVCVIDIYSNLVKEVPSKKDASKMIPVIRGGVNVASVQGIASAIAPVPGGLMQILLVVLFRNSLMAFKYAMLNNAQSV